MKQKFEVGDRVVYTRDKYSTRPGPRAKNVFATPHGETYAYQVDKYWRVIEVQNDGTLVVRTRRGKRHFVNNDDPRLRRASWWEKLLYGGRFPLLDGPVQVDRPAEEPPTHVDDTPPSTPS